MTQVVFCFDIQLLCSAKFQQQLVEVHRLTFETFAAALQSLDVHVNAAFASPLIFRQVTIQVKSATVSNYT